MTRASGTPGSRRQDGPAGKGTPTSGQFSRWGPAQRPAGPRRRRPQPLGWLPSRLVPLKGRMARDSGPPPGELAAGLRPASRGSAKPAVMTPGPANVSAAPPFSCGRGERADPIMRVSPGGVRAERGTTPPLTDARVRRPEASACRPPPGELARGRRSKPSPRFFAVGVTPSRPAARGGAGVNAPTGRTGQRSLASAPSGLSASRLDCISTAKRGTPIAATPPTSRPAPPARAAPLPHPPPGRRLPATPDRG